MLAHHLWEVLPVFIAPISRTSPLWDPVFKPRMTSGVNLGFSAGSSANQNVLPPKKKKKKRLEIKDKRNFCPWEEGAQLLFVQAPLLPDLYLFFTVYPDLLDDKP